MTLVCTTGIILGAAKMLYLYRRVVFGVQKNADAAAMPDLDAREWAMMVPLAVAVLWMGIYPETFLAPMRKDIASLEARVAQARPPGDAQFRFAAAHSAGHAADHSAGEPAAKPAGGHAAAEPEEAH